MAKRVLVFGAGGFIGNALCGALHEQGSQVIAAGRTALAPPRTGLRQITGEFRSAGQFLALMDDCDVVVHLASASTPSSTAHRPLVELEANLHPTLALLEAMQSRPETPLVYLSSAGALYGDCHNAVFDERDPPQPRSYHGAAKAAAELFIGAWCRQTGGSATILRPSNVYGPGQAEHAGFGIVPHAFRAISHGETLDVWGDGSAARDYLYIDDLVDLCCRAINAAPTPGVRTYNAASGVTVRLEELFVELEAASGKPLQRRYQPTRVTDASRVAVSSSCARSALGWSPAVDLPEGLRRTWEWYRSLPA